MDLQEENRADEDEGDCLTFKDFVLKTESTIINPMAKETIKG